MGARCEVNEYPPFRNVYNSKYFGQVRPLGFNLKLRKNATIQIKQSKIQ